MANLAYSGGVCNDCGNNQLALSGSWLNTISWPGYAQWLRNGSMKAYVAVACIKSY
jgi:hypothetical protein